MKWQEFFKAFLLIFIDLESLLSQLNKKIDGCEFSVTEDGAYVTYTPLGGADSVTKKLGEPEFLVDGTWGTTGSTSGASISVDVGAYYVLFVGTAYDSYTKIMKSGGEVILQKKKSIGDRYAILEIVKATAETITMVNITYVEYYKLLSA